MDEAPNTQKELADRLEISPAAVSKQLKKARSIEWLEEDDLRLTEKGQSKIEDMFDPRF